MLVSDHAPDGKEYTRDAMLPDPKNMLAGAFVRARLISPGGEPKLECDEGDLIDFAWQFLTHRIPADWLELCELRDELRHAGVKLPAIFAGRKLFDIGWSDKVRARTFRTLSEP
jgi:hypothetical protein